MRSFPLAPAGAILLLLSACGWPSLAVVGDTPRPPDPPVRLQVVDADGAPVAGAEVHLEGERFRADAAGVVELTWNGGPLVVEVISSGFHGIRTELRHRPEGLERIVLAPVVLSGRVTASDGTPLAGARIGLGSATSVSGPEGTFRVSPAPPGELVVERPAWETARLAWEGGVEGVQVVLHPRRIGALYATGETATEPEEWADLLELAREAGVGGMVVDVKDSSGIVHHASGVALARESGAARAGYDADRVVSDLREAGLYRIARLVAFEDPVVAEARPELAVWDVSREGPWRNHAGRAWLDPTDPAARTYLVDLAVEACRLGFQEIQFDYVRFPTDGPLGRARFDDGYDAEVRVATISGFLGEAREALHREGCAVAADMFGFLTQAIDDGAIGQRLEEVAGSVDVLSPMLYPSHYDPGWYGFSLPNDHPREVVAAALDEALARRDGSTIVRPWLQAFTYGPGIGYGPTQIRAQIEEAEARGLGWMLWNAGSRFHPAAIPDDEEE